MKKRILTLVLAVIMSGASAGSALADGIDRTPHWSVTIDEAEQLYNEGKLRSTTRERLDGIRRDLENGIEWNIVYYENDGTLGLQPVITEQMLEQWAKENEEERKYREKQDAFLATVAPMRESFRVIGKEEGEWDPRVAKAPEGKSYNPYKVTMDWNTIEELDERSAESVVAVDDLANELLTQVTGSTAREKLDSVTKLVCDFWEYDDEWYLYYYIQPYKIQMHRGICQDYAQLEGVMLSKLGYEVKSAVSYDGLGHIWLKVNVDGKWLEVDPTFYDTTGYSIYMGSEKKRTDMECHEEYDFHDQTWAFGGNLLEADENL